MGDYDNIILRKILQNQADVINGVLAFATTGGGGTSNVNLFQIAGTALAAGRSPAVSSIPVVLSNEDVRDLNITGQGAQTASGNNVVLAAAGVTATDANGYRTVAIEIVPTGTVSSGVVTFEGSNDNVNFVAVPLYDVASPLAVPVTTVSPGTGVFRFFAGPMAFQYFRARISTVIGGGGSIQAYTRFSQTTFQPSQYSMVQATAANLNVTVGSGTVTTVTTVTTLANGQTAHSSASTGSPVRIGGRVITTLDTTLVQGDASDVMITSAGQTINKPYGSAENDWSYPAAAAGILNTTTAVTIKAAGAASIRNYITNIQISAEALGAATELAVRDGAAGTVLWRIKLPAGGLPATSFDFTNPLKGTAATLMEVVTLTASITGAVYFNAQGYQSF